MQEKKSACSKKETLSVASRKSFRYSIDRDDPVGFLRRYAAVQILNKGNTGVLYCERQEILRKEEKEIERESTEAGSCFSGYDGCHGSGKIL